MQLCCGNNATRHESSGGASIIEFVNISDRSVEKCESPKFFLSSTLERPNPRLLVS